MMEEPSAASKSAAPAEENAAEVKAVVKKEGTSSGARDDEDRMPSKKRDFSAMVSAASDIEGTKKDSVKDQAELVEEDEKPQGDVKVEENQQVKVAGKVAGSDGTEKVNMQR